jgi:cysteine desulfurase
MPARLLHPKWRMLCEASWLNRSAILPVNTGLANQQNVPCEKARAQVAALLECRPNEIVFTSGGSEANNHALKGVFFAKGQAKAHFITTQVEHPAIVNPCRFLERLGATATYLPVDGFGRVDPDDVRRAITPETILISVMHANNEVGTIQTDS